MIDSVHGAIGSWTYCGATLVSMESFEVTPNDGQTMVNAVVTPMVPITKIQNLTQY